MWTATAPGKAILFGEHAAVYGSPALVAALDLRVRCELAEVDAERDAGDGERRLRIELEDLGLSFEVAAAAAVAAWEEARAAWRRFDRGAGDFRPLGVGARGAQRLVTVAVGQALAAWPEGGQGSAPSATGSELRLSLASEIPLGAGCGSSAAVVTAVLAAFAHRAGGAGSEEELRDLERLALEVERCQHGRPSGIDTTTVRRGGCLWLARDEHRAGGLAVRRLADPRGLLDGFRLFLTGTPVESTGEVVSEVRRRLDGGDAAVRRALRELPATVEEVEALLSGAAPVRGGEAADALRAAVRRASRALEAIGVVPQAVRDGIRAVESAGAAAKISGAGGLRGPGAGLLLVYDPEGVAADELERLAFLPLEARLGATGLELGRRNVVDMQNA